MCSMRMYHARTHMIVSEYNGAGTQSSWLSGIACLTKEEQQCRTRSTEPDFHADQRLSFLHPRRRLFRKDLTNGTQLFGTVKHVE